MKRAYKNMRSGQIQMLEENLAEGFPGWVPCDEKPPCRKASVKTEGFVTLGATMKRSRSEKPKVEPKATEEVKEEE